MSPASVEELIRLVKEDFAAGRAEESSIRLRRLLQSNVEGPKFSELQKLEKLALAPESPLKIKLPHVKLAILGEYNTQPLRVAVRTFLWAEGYWADIYEAEFNTHRTEIWNEKSALYAFRPEIVLYAMSTRNLPATAAQAVSEIQALLQKLHSATKARVLLHNFEAPEERTLGRLEKRMDWSRQSLVDDVNRQLWQLEKDGTTIVDVASLAAHAGHRNWHSPRWYHYAKYGFNVELAADYGSAFAGTFRAVMGKAKKCLTVDLDNTLWGGVIGDDGIDRIALGPGSPDGEAFFDFCQYLKALRDRGVILAVCSKNERETAMQPFLSHPHMPLKPADISAFLSSWNPKSVMITEIAQKLNIGTDSIVFADDNPVECAEVEENLPSVTVVCLGEEPASFIRKIERLHLFDQLTITDEDKKRTENYVSQAKVEELRESFSDINAFLQDLKMSSATEAFNEESLPRLEQLFGKTNQFNLTGKRFSKAELTSSLDSEKHLSLMANLEDRFTNYGLVSALHASVDSGKLEILNWVMSCRVFSRTFEEFIFNELLKIARSRSLKTIRASFLSTPKNGYVKDLLPRLGFQKAGSSEIWEISVDATPLPTHVAGRSKS